ncbi:hypothetical protein F0U62_33745 [Cystobacter fuscus]|uniref:hypothetical protein n=1 Tax=Cystobacter fuscus TaxID=43 RepID=UPI002B28A2FE|nr:hypothetical protein F0U62_33745 [Cystobacter fuscus]
MGRTKRETPPWSSAETALAECKRLLGDERCATVLRGLRRKVSFPRRLRETVALWESLKALGPGLRDLKKTITVAWAVERERTAPVPDLREGIEDAWEELQVSPVGSHAVRDLIARLNPWLSQWDELLKEANRIRPRGEVVETDAVDTTAIARYLVTVSLKGERPITKHIAALLEVAHGMELPEDAVAREIAWEKRLEKWKKALARVRASASPHGRRGRQKLGGDKRSSKPSSVPRK